MQKPEQVSGRIMVDEQEAILIAQMQRRRAERSDQFGISMVSEREWVENCAADILKNGCHPDELQRINDKTTS